MQFLWPKYQVGTPLLHWRPPAKPWICHWSLRGGNWLVIGWRLLLGNPGSVTAYAVQRWWDLEEQSNNLSDSGWSSLFGDLLLRRPDRFSVKLYLEKRFLENVSCVLNGGKFLFSHYRSAKGGVVRCTLTLT